MWLPEPGVGKGEQCEKDEASPLRAMYGEHWDKKGPSRAGVGKVRGLQSFIHGGTNGAALMLNGKPGDVRGTTGEGCCMGT